MSYGMCEIHIQFEMIGNRHAEKQVLLSISNLPTKRTSKWPPVLVSVFLDALPFALTVLADFHHLGAALTILGGGCQLQRPDRALLEVLP